MTTLCEPTANYAIQNWWWTPLGQWWRPSQPRSCPEHAADFNMARDEGSDSVFKYHLPQCYFRSYGFRKNQCCISLYLFCSKKTQRYPYVYFHQTWHSSSPFSVYSFYKIAQARNRISEIPSYKLHLSEMCGRKNTRLEVKTSIMTSCSSKKCDLSKTYDIFKWQ